MTRDDARAYFWDKGLTYADISRTDLVYLRALLDFHFMKHRTEKVKAGLRPYWVRTHLILPHAGEWDESGALECAYLTGKGTFFTVEDVVCFRRDGVICFCWHANEKNAAPVLAAFVEWCDAMAEYKALKKEDEHET